MEYHHFWQKHLTKASFFPAAPPAEISQPSDFLYLKPFTEGHVARFQCEGEKTSHGGTILPEQHGDPTLSVWDFGC